MNILIKKAILHIVDKNSQNLVLSDELLDLENDTVYNFLNKKIDKMLDIMKNKSGEINDNSPIMPFLTNIYDNFLDSSKNIAEKLFQILNQYVEIPAGNILIILVDIETVPHLLICKMGYKEELTHSINYNDDKISTSITKQKELFNSGLNQKDDIAFINLETKNVMIRENRVLLEDYVFYFSQLFLQVSCKESLKDTIKKIDNLAYDVVKKHYDDDLEVLSNVKEEIYKSLDDKKIDIPRLATICFNDNDLAKEEMLANIEELNLNPVIYFNDVNAIESYDKHQIKTNTGIEIKIPIALYQNKNAVEFIKNTDGTTSILIKNIEHLKRR